MVQKYVFLFLIIVSLLFVSSCSSECKKALDCPELNCRTPACISGKCEYTPIPNCCGNAICEDKENKCTCPDDCGECTGSRGEYMQKYCLGEECVFGVPRDKVQEIVISKDKPFGTFEFESIIKYDEPFVLGDSNLTLIFTLKDVESTFIPPVKFTQFRLFEGERLLGKVVTNNFELSKVGESMGINVPFDFSMLESTEEKSVLLKIDYEYRMTTGGGIQLFRNSYMETFPNRFTLINPVLEETK